MLGVSLSFYKQELGFVPVHLNTKPVRSFNLEGTLKVESKEYIEENLHTDRPLEDIVRNIPYELFKPNSFEEICKIRLSSYIMLNNTLEDLFEDNLNYRLIHKIQSSMWRWGHKRSTWNELVHAYNAIRSFSFGREDFTVRLDYTTSVNKKGYSQYSRTFLDGVFAYLVYYQGKHVMTLGFSLSHGKRLLIQQIQLKEQKGNRWLYKLPQNYVEYVIDCFTKAFIGYKLYIIDGEAIAKYYLDSYGEFLEEADTKVNRYSGVVGQEDHYLHYTKERDHYREKVKHMQRDFNRIVNLYNNTGAYTKGKALRINSLDHYKIDKSAPCCYSSAASKE